MLVATTNGVYVSVDDEDFDEYEAVQQEKCEHENDRLAAMGLLITDTRTPMEQWVIDDSSALTEEQSEGQARWRQQTVRWLEDL